MRVLGNPVDDVDLIKILEASKIKSAEIKAKVADAEQTEKEIDLTRSQYIPVAVRTQLLFFCTTDLVWEKRGHVYIYFKLCTQYP